MRLIRTFSALLAMAVSGVPVATATAQSTAITYQGRLDSAGTPYTGTADYRFRLFNAATDGSQVGPDVTAPGISVEQGLFTTRLDFGATAFGADRFLEISVRTPAWDGQGSEPAYFTFPDRQAITPAPYALQTRGIFVDANQNVGIGTTTPTARLEVVGQTRLTGSLTVTQSIQAISSLQVLGPVTLFGQFQTNGASTFNNAANFNAPTSFLAPPTFSNGLISNGPITVGGAATFAQPATFNSIIDATQGVRFSDGSVLNSARPQMLTTLVLVDPPFMLAGAGWANSYGLPGAEVGDPVIVGVTDVTQFASVVVRRAYVLSPGVVRIEYSNEGIVPADVPGMLVKFVVFRF